MKSMLISLGQAASHSRWLVQEPKYSSITSTIASVRRERSGWPWGSRFRWASLAAVKSWPAPLGQAATHAPQPMQAAASIARSAFSFGTAIRFASGAEPVGAVMKPPDSMMRSNAPRSTTRSLMIGKPAARQGSTVIVSPSANSRMCSWQVAVPRWGPWAWPSIISPHEPQMPSRQSDSNATGSRPSPVSCSLSESSSSRNDISCVTSLTS